MDRCRAASRSGPNGSDRHPVGAPVAPAGRAQRGGEPAPLTGRQPQGMPFAHRPGRRHPGVAQHPVQRRPVGLVIHDELGLAGSPSRTDGCLRGPVEPSGRGRRQPTSSSGEGQAEERPQQHGAPGGVDATPGWPERNQQRESAGHGHRWSPPRCVHGIPAVIGCWAGVSAGDGHRRDRTVEHRGDADALELGLGAQGEPVRQGRVGQGLDVVGGDEACARSSRPTRARWPAARSRRGGTRRGTATATDGWPGRCRRCSRRSRERWATCAHRPDPASRSAAGDGADAGRGQVARVEPGGVAPDDLDLLVARRDREQHDLEQEAVELGLGQRVGALVLDGVLGRGHEEGHRQRTGYAVDDTWRSSIASSSAAWVLGGVRLISSASRRLVKTGPSRKEKVELCGSKTSDR
jgi:hypothetical protein